MAKADELRRRPESGSKKTKADAPGETLPQVNTDSVRPRRLSAVYYGRELISNIHDRGDWVNISDGGHIENFGAFELLRRRCRLIIVSDAEADPDYTFNGLAVLIRLAQLELDADITINVNAIKPSKISTQEVKPELPHDEDTSKKHHAVGEVVYSDGTTGKLIYLKSSVTGDEDLPILEYRSRNPIFPQQQTLDQFFDQDQFDSYRLLGIHVATQALTSFVDGRHLTSDMFRSRPQFASTFLLRKSSEDESSS